MFKDLIKSFYLILNNAVDLEILARAFELRILKSTGYGFNFEKCCICNKTINKSNYLSIQYHGGTCSECNKLNGLNLSYGSYNVLKFLDRVTIENIPRLNVTEEIKKEILKILSIFISQCYSKKPSSLEILNYLKGSE